MTKKLTLIALLLCLITLLSACSDVIKVKYIDEGFKDDDTGIGYVLCGRSVYALKVGKVYAKDQHGGEYCVIPYEDPQRFLCDNDPDLPRVYRAEGVEEVTVQNFDPVAAYLFLEGTVSLPIDQFVAEAKYTGNPDVPDDSEYTYALRDAMTQQNPVKLVSPTIDEAVADYIVHIRLLSATYPGLYYEVVFWRDIDGVNYLLDLSTGYSYLCPYKVTARLWGDA